jgi:hypothetical protein
MYIHLNVALNNLHYNVTTHRTALADYTGDGTYYIIDEGDGGGNGLYQEEVKKKHQH